MAHFAQLSEDNIVLQVVVVGNADIMDSNGVEREELGVAFCVKLIGTPYWKRTSPSGTFRKNYATIGGYYCPDLDAFIAPQPFPSWTLNEDTAQWEAPIPYPQGEGRYIWDETNLNWNELV